VARFKIDGIWEGEYSYQPKRDGPEAPPPVRFTLTARAGWFGGFRGTIQDDPSRASRDLATVKGRVSGLSLTFTKQYPEMWVYHQGQSIPMRELLQLEKGLTVDGKIRGYPILYEGDYDEAEQLVSGVWWFVPQAATFRSRGKVYQIPTAGGSGRWTMRRQPSE
jgi:hypothetical protein